MWVKLTKYLNELLIELLVQSQTKGVLRALLVGESGSVVSTSTDIDQFGVLANLQALTGLCTDISKTTYSIYAYII
jgi:hypothetical protein